MTECPLCHASEGFRVKLTDAGAMSTCRACSGVIPEQSQHEPPSPVAAPVARIVAAAAAVRAVTADAAPLDVLKAAKARRKYLVAELRRMAKLKAELDQLDRLLAAAKGTKAARAEGIQATVARLEPRRARTGN